MLTKLYGCQSGAREPGGGGGKGGNCAPNSLSQWDCPHEIITKLPCYHSVEREKITQGKSLDLYKRPFVPLINNNILLLGIFSLNDI